MALLEVRDLSVEYDGARVLREVSMELHPGEVVAVLGANGAGKTTLLRAIAGMKGAVAGRVELDGVQLLGRAPQDIVTRGLALVPQDRGLFPHLSVADNLQVGGFLCQNRREVLRRMDWVFGRFPILRERRRQRAHTLSGGEQQMLAIGRALMRRPKLLMLDEPSLALAPIVVKTIAQIIRELRDEQTTVLLVEQNVSMALAVATRAYVLSGGAVVADAPAAELLKDERVRNAYLGGEAGAGPPLPDDKAAAVPHPSQFPARGTNSTRPAHRA